MEKEILSLYREFSNNLLYIYSKTESQSLVRLLLEKVTGLPSHQLLARNNYLLSNKQVEDLEHYLVLLKLQKPIQYILGEAVFFDLTFRVNSSVLIPRPETEELVRWILEIKDVSKQRILDIGTGSGCIAISLAKNRSSWEVFATDISESALDTARDNASNLDAKVTFVNHNILNQPFPFEKKTLFDIIVSNPPYVRESERLLMEPNVLDNEPPLALFVPDNDPLLFYTAIANFANKYLVENGLVFCEINEALSEDTSHLFNNNGFDFVEIRKDIHGKERMLLVRKGWCAINYVK